MSTISFTVNGLPQTIDVEQDDRRVLIDFLRDDLGLTGTKQSCDRKGQCGACTVIVNNKAVRSCLTKLRTLDGAEVLTIEGLGTPEKPHPIQEAFAIAGAVQCGFCTPGMIMSVKALLDRIPDPDTADIKDALKGNLCRCTGYKKIIDAAKLAASFLSGTTTIEQARPDANDAPIGVSHPRPSALPLVCGTAKFTADIKMDAVLELAAVRSPHAHARIKSIDSSAAEKMPGVVGVITAKDIKGTNLLKADMPLLCDKKVHVLGDAVAAVVAETKEQALAAAEAVEVDYELLPVVSSTEQALKEGCVRVHDDSPNLCFTHPQIKGDAEKALEDSDVIVDERFSTQLIHQAPLEPEVGLAYLEKDEDEEEPKLIVIGRSIWLHGHLLVLQEALGWNNIRYEQQYIGGHFGIKMEVTAEGLAAAAALHFRRPVRYVCSLTESMRITTKRHPFDMHIKLGANRDGKLTALWIDFTLDNGAYTSAGMNIIRRALYMLSGCYQIPHVKALGKLVYTNDAWGGAARGAGPPQANYGLESAMELMAQRLGMDSLEFRLLNSLKPGESISTGQIIEEWPFPGCLEAIRPHYDRARREASENKQRSLKRGVGIAGGSFGVGRGGADTSHVAVELMPDGGVTVYGSVADPGEGNDAMLTQITAHLMDMPRDKVRLVTRDTDNTPDSSTASGSRVTYMSGGALVLAIKALQDAMEEVGATNYDELVAAGKPTKYLGTRVQDATLMDTETGQGAPFESRVHGVQMAEVEVDTVTGRTRIIKMTAAIDPGTVINPNAVEGQIEGGMDMGAGMALREKYIHGETNDWKSINFPTMKTAFDMEIMLLQTPRKKGPLGAVGIGEFVLLPTSAAIISAIQDATGGERIHHLPATPEGVLESLGGRSER